MPMARSRALGCMLLASIMMLGACTPVGPEPPENLPERYRAIFDLHLKSPTEFEREVLWDYAITDAEAQEAKARLKQCMEASGYELDIQEGPDGRFSYSLADVFAKAGGEEAGQAKFDELYSECSDDTESILGLYSEMRDNPEGREAWELVKDCFDRNGIKTGAGQSGREFEELIWSEEWTPATPEEERCLTDPTGG